MFLGFCKGADKVSILLKCDTVTLGIWFPMFCDKTRNVAGLDKNHLQLLAFQYHPSRQSYHGRAK